MPVVVLVETSDNNRGRFLAASHGERADPRPPPSRLGNQPGSGELQIRYTGWLTIPSAKGHRFSTTVDTRQFQAIDERP